MTWSAVAFQDQGGWMRFGPEHTNIDEAIAFLCRVRRTLPERNFALIEIEADAVWDGVPSFVPYETEIILIAAREL